jgi:hypothetical protein
MKVLTIDEAPVGCIETPVILLADVSDLNMFVYVDSFADWLMEIAIRVRELFFLSVQWSAKCVFSGFYRRKAHSRQAATSSFTSNSFNPALI